MIPMRMLALVAALLTLAGSMTFAQGSEEAAVKATIETFIRGFNKGDLNVMLAQLSDDAKVYSRVAQSQVSKEKYAEITADVLKKGDVISVDVRDMNVTMASPSRATVNASVYMVTRTSRPSGRAEYQLEKRDGRWLIVETMPK